MDRHCVNWAAVSDACPNPLPSDIASLDALVKNHRPLLWRDDANSKKRKQWRNAFCAYVNGQRWRQENPNASCASCKHLDAHKASNTGYSCGLGYDSGGWFSPVKLDKWCGLYVAKTKIITG